MFSGDGSSAGSPPLRRRWLSSKPYLVGQTAIGHVTVALLQINDELRLEPRESLTAEGLFECSLPLPRSKRYDRNT
jgi:hypothetical protein